jgi:hypothetical protein
MICPVHACSVTGAGFFVPARRSFPRGAVLDLSGLPQLSIDRALFLDG